MLMLLLTQQIAVWPVQADALDQEALSAINAYSPGLSSAWMLQRAMSVRPNRSPSPDFVNRLLGANFAAMQRDSEATLKTFLQVALAWDCLRIAHT